MASRLGVYPPLLDIYSLVKTYQHGVELAFPRFSGLSQMWSTSKVTFDKLAAVSYRAVFK